MMRNVELMSDCCHATIISIHKSRTACGKSCMYQNAVVVIHYCIFIIFIFMVFVYMSATEMLDCCKRFSNIAALTERAAARYLVT